MTGSRQSELERVLISVWAGVVMGHPEWADESDASAEAVVDLLGHAGATCDQTSLRITSRARINVRHLDERITQGEASCWNNLRDGTRNRGRETRAGTDHQN